MVLRHLFATLLVALLPAFSAAAQEPSPRTSLPPAPTATAEQMREGRALIEKAVQAFGGGAAVDAVSGLELKGTGTRRIQANDVSVTTLTRYFFPDRYYQELVLPMGVMKTVLSRDAAFIVAGEGTLPLPDSERKSMMKLMQRNVIAVLRGRNEPGFAASVVGTATVEGTAVQLVKVTRGGDVLTLAIDPVTGQVRQTRWDSAGGLSPTGELVVTYSDYRPAGPIRYPFRASATMAGQRAFTQTLESLVVNPPVDEALFKAPPEHTMFPGVRDLPSPSPSPLLVPPPTLMPRPSPSPTTIPRE